MIEEINLYEAAEKRYLNYALSVITARALPDIRDGLKPVQRRILYGMYGLRLSPEKKHRKSAAVVGEVMAKYHPHGDQSIYDAMVRMAQPFAFRYPLVDGQGNFGSLDGDGAAAMRYTEAKLRHLTNELLEELPKNTVTFRQNYDGTREEPVVLPAQLPNLLLNGATGIAVGMATNIPPHNLGETIGALLRIIDFREKYGDQKEFSLEYVMRYFKGPDFPTAGELLNSRASLVKIYTKGRGTLELRGEWTTEKEGRKDYLILTSIPFGVNKTLLIESIAEHIQKNNIPQVLDIRDESTEEIRIVLELRQSIDVKAVLAFLYKKTAFFKRFHVNMTVLLPTKDPLVTHPKQIGLAEALNQFLLFRYDITKRKLKHSRRLLNERIHLLRGLVILFNDIETTIELIQNSDEKKDAKRALIEHFKLEERQVEAILETKLYRLGKMEIGEIRKELTKKEHAEEEIEEILSKEANMWKLIRSELQEIKNAYKDRRRTKVIGPRAEIQFTEENYILEENTIVMVSRAGWIKRQKSYLEVSKIRTKEGDEMGWILPTSTRGSVVILTDKGKAYSLRVTDLPLTTGYGDAIQTRFNFKDGEQIIGVFVTDEKTLSKKQNVLCITRYGRGLRFPLENHKEPSTTVGRSFIRLDAEKQKDAVVRAFLCRNNYLVSLATRNGRCLVFPAYEAKLLKGIGKGNLLVRIKKNDFVLGFVLIKNGNDGLKVETNQGRSITITKRKFRMTVHGNQGKPLFGKGKTGKTTAYLARVHYPTIEVQRDDLEVLENVEPNYEQQSVIDNRKKQDSEFKTENVGLNGQLSILSDRKK